MKIILKLIRMIIKTINDNTVLETIINETDNTGNWKWFIIPVIIIINEQDNKYY